MIVALVLQPLRMAVFALWYDEGMKLLLATLVVITAPLWIPLAILFAAISTVYGHIDGIHSTYRKMRE